MVKPLSFKGDKKVKKRKRVADEGAADGNADPDARASKALTTATSTSATDAAQEDDSWVSADAPTDVSGPIVVVLPTEPPTCLACDANGKVFCSPLENCVDGDPATSEPHDVRQVWVATRVAGTESFSLKGHHGRYVPSRNRA
jgi:protein FRG1